MIEKDSGSEQHKWLKAALSPDQSVTSGGFELKKNEDRRAYSSIMVKGGDLELNNCEGRWVRVGYSRDPKG